MAARFACHGRMAQEFRSHSGGDSERNVITLCAPYYDFCAALAAGMRSARLSLNGIKRLTSTDPKRLLGHLMKE
jgi:hypothetical protein